MGYLPISLDNPLKEPKTLKSDNRELYNIIKRSILDLKAKSLARIKNTR
jgi:hypothetical protein